MISLHEEIMQNKMAAMQNLYLALHFMVITNKPWELGKLNLVRRQNIYEPLV
jgi:hypothetical protein